MSKKSTFITKTEEKEGGLFEITASIPWETVTQERAHAIVNLGKDLSVPGFRKGHIPAKTLESMLGEFRIGEEAARLSIHKNYASILEESGKDLIGLPQISITKLAPENPLEFTITATLAPTVELPDYKKLITESFKKNPKSVVTDTEVEEGINHIRKEWARSEKWEKAREEAEENETVPFQDITVEDAELPELNDEFAKKVGNFETVDEFKKQFKETLGKEKEIREEEKQLAEALQEVVEASTATIPTLLLEGERARIEHEFNHSLERAGISFDDFLKESKKTKEEIQEEWKNAAEKRIKTQLILNEIGKKEGLRATEEEIHEEAHALMRQYKNISHDQAEDHVRSILQNRVVLRFISSLREEKK